MKIRVGSAIMGLALVGFFAPGSAVGQEHSRMRPEGHGHTPEPATLTILALGAGVVAGAARLRRRK